MATDPYSVRIAAGHSLAGQYRDGIDNGVRTIQRPRSARRIGALICGGLLCLIACQPGIAQDRVPSATPLVKVNGATITDADLRLDFYVRQLPETATVERRRELLESLVDRMLIEQFLQRRKIQAPAEEIDRQLEITRQLITAAGKDFESTLAELGLSIDQFKQTLALPLAWKLHVSRTVTDSQVREYFQEHRRELDGTKLSGSQIVKVIPADAEPSAWDAAAKELAALRGEIVAGKLTFADGARAHSDSPSSAQGGDLGRFEYRGMLPEEITAVAFRLKPGEISEPFRTRFGMHLVLVTSEIPGQLSPEDVRPVILRALGDRLWKEQTAIERKRARIEWLSTGQHERQAP